MRLLITRIVGTTSILIVGPSLPTPWIKRNKQLELGMLVISVISGDHSPTILPTIFPTVTQELKKID
jgi:hypothetical protein